MRGASVQETTAACLHMSAYVSIRQQASQHTSAYANIRQHTSAYVTAYVTAYVSIRALVTYARALEARLVGIEEREGWEEAYRVAALAMLLPQVRLHTSA